MIRRSRGDSPISAMLRCVLGPLPGPPQSAVAVSDPDGSKRMMDKTGFLRAALVFIQTAALCMPRNDAANMIRASPLADSQHLAIALTYRNRRRATFGVVPAF